VCLTLLIDQQLLFVDLMVRQSLYLMMIILVVRLELTQQDALEERNLSKTPTLQFRQPLTTQGDLETGVNQLPMVESWASTLAQSQGSRDHS
jgi:hypothetical protein